MKESKHKLITFALIFFASIVFIIGLIFLVIFSVIPSLNKNNYIAQIEKCAENYFIQNNYFNIVIETKNNDKVVLSQNYKCVIDGGNVCYELYQENKSPKLMINNICFEPNIVGYKYKYEAKNIPSSLFDVLKEISFSGDVNYNEIESSDITYIRKSGNKYILNLNINLLKKEMPQSYLDAIEFKTGLNGEILTNNGVIEQFTIKTKIYIKETKQNINLISTIQFLNILPEIENNYGDVPWLVDEIQTEENLLNQFYKNNLVKATTLNALNFESMMSASKNNKTYLYANKYVYLMDNEIGIFDLQSKQFQTFEVANCDGVFYDKYYVCWDKKGVYKFNIPTCEITTTIKEVDGVYYNYNQYQNYLILYEKYDLLSYRFVIYNLFNDKIEFVDAGDYITSTYCNAYLKNNILYFLYVTYNHCNLYKYDILNNTKTFIKTFNSETIPYLKYISKEDEVFYLYGDNIYKLNSEFAYVNGDIYEDNDNICVKTEEYIYVYKNDKLIDTIQVVSIPEKEDIYSDKDLICFDDNNVYIKGKEHIYHGSYECFSTIKNIYAFDNLLQPIVQDVYSDKILTSARIYDFVEANYKHYLLVYLKEDLTKPVIIGEINSQSLNLKFEKIQISKDFELIYINNEIYLLSKNK